MLRYLAIRSKAIRAEIRFGSRSAYWSLKFEAYCPRAKLEAKPKLDNTAHKIADFLFARAPSFSSLDAATYPAQITIIMTAPTCMPFGRFPLRLENIKEKTGYPPTIGATNFIGPFIKALYKLSIRYYMHLAGTSLKMTHRPSRRVIAKEKRGGERNIVWLPPFEPRIETLIL